MRPRDVLHRLAIVFSVLAAGRIVCCDAADRSSETRVVESDSSMVVAVSPPAVEAGAEVLRSGGNAVDAAVAVALAMAVTYPPAGNIGGGGFMMVHPPGATAETVCIDYRETAPAAATPALA